MRIRISDYIADFFASRGIKDVFTVVGGGAMYLNNSFGNHKGIKCHYNHHEEASATAAEGYARITKKPAICCVTTGPGGTNAITGVAGAWLDSIPMIVISGQVKRETTVRSTSIPQLRQLGDQEIDITKMVSSITKYSVMITHPEEVRYHLEKALFLTTYGRPGPVWLDVPIDIQSYDIDADDMNCFDPNEEFDKSSDPDKGTIDSVLKLVEKSDRPVIYAGYGIHASNSESIFINVVDKMKIPVCLGFSAHDLIPYDNQYYIGRPGTIGDRAGNYAIQNSDLVIVLGCRLNIRQIGYNYKTFAREAKLIMVDIDASELNKPTLSIDMKICCDVKKFLEMLYSRCTTHTKHRQWLDWCLQRKEKYQVCLPEYYKGEEVNPYCFMDEFGKICKEKQIMVATNASACICSFQTIKIKKGQRLFSNSGLAQMGYGLPASIGAYYASNSDIVCFEGDGSIQMNIQELQTVAYNKLPIKIFILNNKGYSSIRQTQSNFFNGVYNGCDEASGVSFPNMEKISNAYGIPYICICKHDEMTEKITSALETNGPIICEVMITPKQGFSPKTSSKKTEKGIISKPLEDMAPFLSREEHLSNMIIKPLE